MRKERIDVSVFLRNNLYVYFTILIDITILQTFERENEVSVSLVNMTSLFNVSGTKSNNYMKQTVTKIRHLHILSSRKNLIELLT